MRKPFLWMLALCLMAVISPHAYAMDMEMENSLEVTSPGFTYHTIGTEAAELLKLKYDHVQVAGGLFVLEDGYLSVGYTQEDQHTISIFPAGAGLTCLNSDLSVRWVLEDERLAGAWYTDLIELDNALLLGSDRSLPQGDGQVPSLMLIEKSTGAIRWQVEGISSNVWISDFIVNADGNLLIASNGPLNGNVGGAGTLTLLDASNGRTIWSLDYLKDHELTALRDICSLEDGLLLYGDQTVLYTDLEGAVRGWFGFQAWENGHDYTSLWLTPISEKAVYLAGWELEENSDRSAEIPYQGRTLMMMRISEDVFLSAGSEQ